MDFDQKYSKRVSSEYSANSFASVFVDKKNVVDEKSDLKNRGRLYRLLFSTWMPRVAIIPSVIMGSTPIITYLVFGIVLNAHTRYVADPNYPAMHEIRNGCIYLIDVAVISAVCKYLNSFMWIRIGSAFSLKLRTELFANMMKSDVAFFDSNPIGGIMTLLSEDSQIVQDAFGSTKGTQFSNLSQFLVGIILSYIYSWKLALIATAVVPLGIITIASFSKCIDRHVNLKFIYLSESMTIAEETLAAVRTVRGFNREKQELTRFMKQVKKTRGEDRKIGQLVNIMFSFVILFLWTMVCGNLYWGATMVQSNDMEPGDLFSVFGFLIFGGFGIIELQASLQGEQKAIASGGRILDLTHHVPAIPFDGGKKIEDFKGKIEFKCVSFKYPTRDVYVLKHVSFVINPGQMGALVGHSGSGKSTCVALLERYYDCEGGEILLDGVNIKELDPHWLHQRIALVSQEPSLFQMSIKNNIRYGAPKATMEQVEAAAEIANAKKFIMKFEKKYEQMVGEKGSSLSGGQRQRVAIARAVVKDPVILITDEATSALDADSEKKVQVALDKVMKNRTAVIVAHRLSTIKNAHIIYVFDAGEIKEIGTHDELVHKHGYYFELVRRQLTKEEVDEVNKENEERQKEIDNSDSDSSSSDSSSATSDSDSSSESDSKKKKNSSDNSENNEVVEQNQNKSSSADSSESPKPREKGEEVKEEESTSDESSSSKSSSSQTTEKQEEEKEKEEEAKKEDKEETSTSTDESSDSSSSNSTSESS